MREIHVGRLIHHVHLRASDLAAAKRFYRAPGERQYPPGAASADSVVIRA
jgi:catechol 2,3-dioxygenase-like lactoylglutathione lyase family enzyme